MARDQGNRKVIELPAAPFALSLWKGRRQWFDKFTTNGICARHGPCNTHGPEIRTIAKSLYSFVLKAVKDFLES